MTMSTSPKSSLMQTLQDVTTALPTIVTQMNAHSEPSTDLLSTTTSFTDVLESSSRGNGSSVSVEDTFEYSPTWLTIRLGIVACVVVGIVLMALASYTVHTKWCTNKDKYRLELQYQKTTAPMMI